jgi:hypothetical protein
MRNWPSCEYSAGATNGYREDGLAMDLVLGVFDFLAPSSPSIQADFDVLNYFFRTGVLHFLDFSAKNHPIIQFKVEFVQLL